MSDETLPLAGFMAEHRMLASRLLLSDLVHTGEWQAMNTTASPAHATYELLGEQLSWYIPTSKHVLAQYVHPDLPWAEEHFNERVSGIPHNPPPSHVRWPYAVRGNGDHTDAGKFSHTYPERFWPKHANGGGKCNTPEECMGTCGGYHYDRRGIRYRYGDLSDVVDLLVRSPLTRQAYLPVWFPEDTGAHHGQRVPCTLGYHFMIRRQQLHCWYAIRSCDFIRHYRNDVFMAGRLMQRVTDHVNDRWNTEGVPEGHPLTQNLRTGILTMTISSLHVFMADRGKLEVITRS